MIDEDIDAHQTSVTKHVSFGSVTVRSLPRAPLGVGVSDREQRDMVADMYEGMPGLDSIEFESSESESSSDEDVIGDREYLHPRRRRWPHPAPQCGAAENEPPWAGISRDEADTAHGVGNDRLGERDEVLRVSPLPFRNKPPIRVAPPPVKAQQPFTRADGSTWAYRTGHLEDGLCSFRFFAHEHGPWVSYRMSQLNIPAKTGWFLSAKQLLDEIIHWFCVHRGDIRRARVQLKNTGSIEDFQPESKTWIIPEKATHPCARRRVYDWRVAMKAHMAGERDYEVPLLDTSSPGAHWNKEFFGKLFQESKMPDQASEQCILETGINVPFLSNWDSILVAAPRGFYAELEFCSETTLDEIERGILDGPHPAAPLWPLKMHGRAGVVIFRNGKVKKRDVGDLSGKGRFEAYHTNAGWCMDSDGFYYPILSYVSTAEFALDCAVVQTAWGSDFEIQTADWRSYYRQLLRHRSLWWLYVALSLEAGCTIDKFAIFGDGSSVPWANYIMNALLYGVRHIMMRTWNLGDDCSQWVPRMQAYKHWPQRVRDWIRDRAAILPQPSSKSWRALSRPQAFTEMQRFWACCPIAIAGYFDDGFSGGGAHINRLFMDSLLILVRDGGVQASIPKFERFTTEGLSYVMSEDTLDWVLNTASQSTPMHAIILGKEFRIRERIRCDPAERLRLVCNLTSEIIRIAHASKTRLVPLAAGERLRGQWNWVTETCKLLRSLLSGLTASMAVSRRIGAGKKGFGHRRVLKFEMSKAAFDNDQSTRTWSWSQWKVSNYFPLSYVAEEELLQLAGAIHRCNATAWYPRRSPVPLTRIGFVVNDSAGKSSSDPRSRRGAAAWLFIEGLDNIPYIIEEWGEQALNTLHSTQQEAGNAAANVDFWAKKYPHIEVWIEILDSRSTVYNFRRVAARRPGLEPVIRQRIQTLHELNARGVRILSIWAARELNFIADLLSKYKVHRAIRALITRAPNQFLADAPDVRPPNVFNTML